MRPSAHRFFVTLTMSVPFRLGLLIVLAAPVGLSAQGSGSNSYPALVISSTLGAANCTCFAPVKVPRP